MLLNDYWNGLAARALKHWQDGTTDSAPGTLDIPVETYMDEQRYHEQFDTIFLRKPQAIMLSIELPKPGDYVARDMLGKPLLVVRGKDGVARVFLNVCRHRGAQLCQHGKGNVPRFVCPYHAWSFSREGKLVGVTGKDKFGDADMATLGLSELPSTEVAGVIWAVLTVGGNLDIDAWLEGMREKLEELDFTNCHLFDQRTIPSSGWRATMDGYLEAYHHDTTHAATLSKHTIGNLMLHDVYGHHQLLTMARRTLPALGELPQEQWDAQNHLRQIFCIFPNFQVSGILGGYFLVSQILPGPTVGESVTYQTILTTKAPQTPEEVADAEAFRDLAYHAVEHEDYPIAFSIQHGLGSGANQSFLIGRNEPGLQHYHKVVAQLTAGGCVRRKSS